MADVSILIAAATRPCVGETENGDAWQVDWRGADCRIVLIDALGHGPLAAGIATDARKALTRTTSFDPTEVLRNCQAALAGGRGAAVSAIRIDVASSQLTFAGIGNVDAVLWTPDHEKRMSPDRGIVGSATRQLHPIVLDLPDTWLLAMFSDGISARFRLADLFAGTDIQGLADKLLADWSRPRDDATVVVASSGYGIAGQRSAA